jgi:TolB-like protein
MADFDDPVPIPERIGPYRVLRQIGRGAMGIVYEAIDERLDRNVALKRVLPAADPQHRDRLIREARAAASVNHPNICQLFEIGEDAGEPFLAMERLEGRSLADRLTEGPLPVAEAINTMLLVLSALEALHAQRLVHRDLKPSNIFLTPHGVKLLDFGLARPVVTEVDATSLTLPGVVLGTPKYMAPEQARGLELDGRTDLFAAGAILFELLSGRPAFNGPSAIEVMYAVVNEQPPALLGSFAVIAADRVIQRALAKAPADRYGSAGEMARDLRACLSHADAGAEVVARATTRLVVPPFRMLRADAEVDFLAFSLADAITVALSGLESLVVRSSLAAARLATDDPDWLSRAREANVDVVVAGSLLRAGDMLRVSVQLVETAAGTVLWSHALQVPVDDLFSVESAVSSAVVEALALPLSSREQRQLRRDVPASAAAYAAYLRGNRLSTNASQWRLAREEYLRAVEDDPSYAPAWARLGRCLRVLGKYGLGEDAARHTRDAEAAFQRAFELNPELSLTHNLYTYVEVDQGRALDAVLRLLQRLQSQPADADVLAGLVHGCRYLGLVDASLAAHDRARRLDPGVRTTVVHTFFMRGEFEKAVDADTADVPYVGVHALLALGRIREAHALCSRARPSLPDEHHLAAVLDTLTAAAEDRPESGVLAIETLESLWRFTDPEGFYYWAHSCAWLRDVDRALRLLRRAVDNGFYCVRGFETSPAFDAFRLDPVFTGIVDDARRQHARAADAFAAAGGPRLLGLPR